MPVNKKMATQGPLAKYVAYMYIETLATHSSNAAI